MIYPLPDDALSMCESSVFLETEGRVEEIMKDVTRVVMDGQDAICTDILGQKVVLKKVVFKEANLLSHGLVFVRN